MDDLQLIRPNKAAKLLGISIPTLYRRCKEPDFPNKIQISKRAVGFRKSELVSWLEKKGQSNQQPEAV